MATSGSSQSRLHLMAPRLPGVHLDLAARLVTVAVLGAHRRRLDADRPHAAPAAEQAAQAVHRRRGSRRCTAPSSRAAGCRRCVPRADRAVSSVGRRDSSTRRASPSLRASASAHLSTSPGGSTPSSSRSWPELPPLSNIVTTALRCSQGLVLSPPSRLGSPVPPPKQPMFSSRNCIVAIVRLGLRSTVSVRSCGPVACRAEVQFRTRTVDRDRRP